MPEAFSAEEVHDDHRQGAAPPRRHRDRGSRPPAGAGGDSRSRSGRGPVRDHRRGRQGRRAGVPRVPVARPRRPGADRRFDPPHDARARRVAWRRIALEETGLGPGRGQDAQEPPRDQPHPGSRGPRADHRDRRRRDDAHRDGPLRVWSASITPTTNPVSTIINNAIAVLSGGNAAGLQRASQRQAGVGRERPAAQPGDHRRRGTPRPGDRHRPSRPSRAPRS